MKKAKTLLLAAALLVAVLTNSFGLSHSASAWVGDAYESPEIAFESVMGEMNSDFGYEYDTYTYTSAPTHDLDGP